MNTPLRTSLSVVFFASVIVASAAQVLEQPLVVTAAATVDRVRFTAPASIAQMRVEVLSKGLTVFDSAWRNTNVFDWRVTDSEGHALSAGVYEALVTVRYLDGRFGVRQAVIRTGGAQVTVQRPEAGDPVAVIDEEPGQSGPSMMLLSHDGEGGSVVTTRGDLSFRFGDFFRGHEVEWMRLTSRGDLGIGTATPQAKLDVAGLIRTTEGILFADGSVQKTAAAGANETRQAVVATAGTGTANQVAKWVDGAGTLANSTITELNGKVGIGTTAPGGQLHIFGAGNLDIFSGMGPNVITGPAMNYGYSGASFGRGSGFFNVRPDASAAAPNPSLRFMTINQQRMIISNKGDVGIGITGVLPARLAVSGPDAPPPVSSVNGTNALDALRVVGGLGGATTDTSGFALGGRGAGVLLQGGIGGTAVDGFDPGTFGINRGGAGGSITLQPGLGGPSLGGASIEGRPGSVVLAPSAGAVGVGISPTYPSTEVKLQVNGPVLIGSPSGLNTGYQLYVYNPASGCGLCAGGIKVDTSPGGRAATFGPYGAFEIDSTGPMGYAPGGRFEVTEAGNVGIGTAGPDAKLQVAGNVHVNDQVSWSNSVLSSAAGGSIELGGTDSIAGTGNPSIDFHFNDGSLPAEDWNVRLVNDDHGVLTVEGNLTVNGDLIKRGGSFRIDHPLDPENKYLSHSFVESPDMMNIYNGNVVLDDRGQAVVVMPEWFEALNRDFRYQLTCMHGFAPVYIDEEISGNQFKIAGGRPGLKVSWMVTGVRHDAYANAHRIRVEEEKGPAERR